MKKKKPRIFQLNNPLYHYTVFIIIGGSRDEAIKWFENKFETQPTEVSSKGKCRNATTIFADGIRDHIIWFDKIPGASIVAHEGLHSVIHALIESGMGSLCEANEEAYAYCLQWLTQKIGEKIW